MGSRDFQRRWLLRMESTERAIPQLLESIGRRARRYPRPMGFLHAVFTFCVEYFFPFFLLGIPRRASRLGDAAWDRLESAASGSRFSSVRAVFLLIRLPLWEARFPDSLPLFKPHPLRGAALASRPGRAPDRRDEGYDCLVIGSGAGGAPVAWALAAAGRKVALLEQGGVIEASTSSVALRDYYFKQAFSVAIGGGIAPVMAGVGLGGTTAINSGTSLAPMAEYLDRWNVEGFDPRVLDPYVEQVIRHLPVVTPPRELLGRSGLIFEEGLRKLGRMESFVLPRNSPECEGAGRCPFGCPVHAKRSTDHSFIPDAIALGCEVHSGARVTSIREDSGSKTVTVVARWSDGAERTFRARQCVISAGAFATPGILRANRLGTSWRKAGEGLKIHPATKLFALMPAPVNEQGVPQGIGYRPPDIPRLVMEGVHTPASAAAPIIPASGNVFREWMGAYDRIATFGMMVIERNRGSVRWIADWPVIRHSLSPEDRRDLSKGILLAAEAFFAAGAERVLLPMLGLDNEIHSIEELRAIDPEHFTASRMVRSGFHAQGTAGMGRVVDANLKVPGTTGIHVCDASVLPDSPGVNPQVTIMALALRLADRLSGAEATR